MCAGTKKTFLSSSIFTENLAGQRQWLEMEGTRAEPAPTRRYGRLVVMWPPPSVSGVPTGATRAVATRPVGVVAEAARERDSKSRVDSWRGACGWGAWPWGGPGGRAPAASEGESPFTTGRSNKAHKAS